MSNGNNYKLYISAKYEQILDIIFLKNDPYFTESQKINIYEYSNRDSEKDLAMTTLYLSYDSSANTYTLTYIVKGSRLTNFIAFEMKPYFEMKNVLVRVDARSPELSNNGSTNAIIIAISIITSICIIGIIVCIYFTKCKKNDKNFQNVSNEAITPMYPKD